MKDFNFFSPYIEIKKTSKTKTIYAVLLTFTISAAMAGLFSWNQYNIILLEKDLKNKFAVIESSELKEKVKEYQLMTERVKLLSNYNSILENVSRRLDASAVINSSYMLRLSDAFPEGTFVRTLTLSQNTINIQGISNSRIAVAELQHNLKQVEHISAVQISNITNESLESGTYVFNISCKLGALNQNEAEQ